MTNYSPILILIITKLLTLQSLFVHDENPENAGLSMEGDVMVGGLFNLHQTIVSVNEDGVTTTECSTLVNDNVILVEAMIFAIGEVNANPNLLANIKIGYDIQGSCDEPAENMFYAINAFTALEARLVAENKSQCGFVCVKILPLIAGLIGPASDTASESISSLFRLHSIPLISYSSAAPQLSNHFLYPSFFRTIYADDKQAKALADLVEEMGWTYIAAIGVDEDLGRQGIYELKRSIWNVNGMCLSMEDYFNDDEEIRDIVNDMKEGIKAETNTSITVAILFMDFPNAYRFLKIAYEMGLTETTWIGVDHWTNAMGMILDVAGHIPPEWINGSLATQIPHQLPIDFKIFEEFGIRNRLSHNSLLKTFVCQQCHKKINPNVSHMSIDCNMDFIKNCFQKEAINMADVVLQQPRIVNVISAVNALAHALNSSYTIVKQQEKLVDVAHWTLVQELNDLNYSQASDKWPSAPPLNFDKNGNLEGAVFTIKNFYKDASTAFADDQVHSTIQSYHVGDWCEKTGLHINKTAIRWKTKNVPLSMCHRLCVAGERTVYGPTSCCWECEKCPHGSVTNQTQQVKCSVCPKNTHQNDGQTFCIKNRIVKITYDSVIGILNATLNFIGLSFVIISLIITLKFKNRPSFQDKETIKSAVLVNCTMGYLYSVYAGEPSECICTLRRLLWQLTINMHCVTGFFMASVGRRLSKFLLHKPMGIREKYCPLVANWIFACVGGGMLILLASLYPAKVDLIDLEKVTGEHAATYKDCGENCAGGLSLIISTLYPLMFWIPALVDSFRIQRLLSIKQFVDSTRGYTNDGKKDKESKKSKYEKLHITHILYSSYISALLVAALGPIYATMSDPMNRNLISIMGVFTANTTVLGFYIFPRIKKSLLARLSKGHSRVLSRTNSMGEMFIISAKFSVAIHTRR